MSANGNSGTFVASGTAVPSGDSNKIQINCTFKSQAKTGDVLHAQITTDNFMRIDFNFATSVL